MKRAALIPLTLLLLVSISVVLPYSRPRFNSGQAGVVQSRWSVPTPVPIVVNLDTPNTIVPGSQPFEAVRNAFEMRSAYSTIRFAPVVGSNPDDLGQDGSNLVTFVDTPSNRSVTAGFGAVTFFWFGAFNGSEFVMTESDIAFNPATASHSTNLAANSFDIEALTGHEIDHFISLEHSAVMGATGYPNFFTQDTTKRSLALDDRAGTEFLYSFPDFATRTGTLSGTLLKQFIVNTAPILGAQVTAVRQSDGAVVSEIAVADGEWRIDGLPPGDYTLYGEPLDGPYFSPGLINDGIYGGLVWDNTFGTAFAGGNAIPTVYTVAAGTETRDIEIVAPSALTPLNIRLIGRSFNGTTPFNTGVAVAITQGETLFLTVNGPGMDSVPDDGIRISGTGVTVSSSGVARGVAGDPYMIVEVTAAFDAAPTTRAIIAESATELAAASGGLEVLRSTPLPGLLRNDDVTALQPTAPDLSSIFQPGSPSLEPIGPDAFPGIGEGTLREVNGSDDDDDLYVPEVPSGYLEADLDVLADASRPLVFYQLTDPGATLRLNQVVVEVRSCSQNLQPCRVESDCAEFCTVDGTPCQGDVDCLTPIGICSLSTDSFCQIDDDCPGLFDICLNIQDQVCSNTNTCLSDTSGRRLQILY